MYIFKNKKSIKRIAFTALVAVTTATVSADLLAEDIAESLESEVDIVFKKGNADVDPLDPENPTLPEVADPSTPGVPSRSITSRISRLANRIFPLTTELTKHFRICRMFR